MINDTVVLEAGSGSKSQSLCKPHSQDTCQSLPAPEGSHLEDARNFRVITSKPGDRPESVIMMAV